MNDFPTWRESILGAKTVPALKAIGESLAQFQGQSGLFGDEESKLNPAQVAFLRTLYSERLKKLQDEKL